MSRIANWIKKYNCQILAFLCALIPRLILNCFALPLRTQSDELATLAGGAFLGGKDWSGIVSQAGYYGFGFTALFAPLFRLSDDPVLIYRLILVVESVMQASIALMAFYLMKRYFKIEHKWFLTVASVACSYMVVTRTMIEYNEHALIFCSWLICVLLFRLLEHQNDSKKKAIDTVLLMALLSYTLLLHTRSWMYWIVLAIFYVAYFIRNRRSFLAILPGIITAVIGVGGGKLLIHRMQERIWLADGNGGLRNSSVSLSLSDTIVNATSWHTWVNIIFGQLNTVSVISGGMLIVAVLLMIRCIIGWMKRGERFHCVKVDREEILYEDHYAIIFIYFGLCTALTIGAQSLIWLPRATQAMELGFASNGYGLKAVTYVRYMGPYLGPVLMATLCYLYQEQNQIQKIYKQAIFWIAGLQAFWLTCILPFVYTNSNVIETYLPFSLQTRRAMDVGRMVFLPATGILLIVVILNQIWLKKKKWKPVLLTLAVLLTYQYCYNAVAYDINTQSVNHKEIDATYNMFCQLKESGNMPEAIYVVDTRDKTDHQSYYQAQYYLQGVRIIAGYPPEDAEEAMICLNSNMCPAELMQDDSYRCVKLDRNEYVWIKGTSLIQTCEAMGYVPEIPNVYIATGKVTSFSDHYENGKMLQTGWYEQEDWGVWSGKQTADLFFILQEEQQKGCTMNLRMYCYDSMKTVTVFINGEYVATLPVDNRTDNYTIRIPKRLAEQERIYMTFQINEELQSPLELGQSEDTRTLGIALYSIQIKE